MKFNKWTLGLAAVGAVSLASVVNAEEKAPTFLETAVSGTQISGYVNTSAHWNPGDNGTFTGLTAYQQGTAFSGSTTKADGFNLDAVSITIAKPLDETEWASGYNVQLVYGQDAGFLGYEENQPIKQAYVELRTPVGNGIDWKIGVFNTILGYESFDAGNNPNYTRSYGYTIEPTTHTGILASYKFCNILSAQLGVANTTDAGYGARSGRSESSKSYMGSITMTAPESWGALAGSQVYAAAVVGQQSGTHQDTANYYVGTVLNTGVKGLKVGASYDYAGLDSTTTGADSTGNIGGLTPGGFRTAAWANAVAVYASFQATEKLSLHGRGEYAWADAGLTGVNNNVYAVTGTVQYDLWKNVLSRLEVRWDHVNSGLFGQTDSKKNNVLLAANVIYKF